MGDCRIRILFAQNLLSSDNSGSNDTDPDNNSNSNNKNPQQWKEVLNKLFSSDTTVREVCDDPGILMPLLEQGDACLWDCTLHPPNNITEWPLLQYSHIQGLQSKTLFDAGWFPSGTLRVSRKSAGVPKAASSSLQNDEAQYNVRSEVIVAPCSASDGVPLLVNNAAAATPLLPSQLLESVTKRFDGDDEIVSTDDDFRRAVQERRQNKKAKAEREQERFQKLEARIQRLVNSQSKKNTSKPAVSDQVRRMLIKSRATGAKSLKQQDRIYFHIVMDEATSSTNDDDEEEDSTAKEEFRFFSIQDTVGRGILSRFTIHNGSSSDRQSELLVRQTSRTNDAMEEGPVVYRRLPNAMRVHEAIEQQYLEPEVNKVVIRWYNPSLEDPTTTIVEETETVEKRTPQNSSVNMQRSNSPLATEGATSTTGEPANATMQSSGGESALLEDATLAALIRQQDQEEQKKSKKKSSKSSTSTKVRHMLMKSKAKGDAKRLKMEERFFFELVTVVMTSNNEHGSCETSVAYLGKKDPLGRILRDCVKPTLSANNKGDEDFELLVPTQNGTSEAECSDKFHRLDNLGMSFHEADTAKLLKPFDRLVLRFHASQLS